MSDATRDAGRLRQGDGPDQQRLRIRRGAPSADTNSVVRRELSVKGSGGAVATVVITAQRGQVWVSIVPPFMWEAIMEPGEVDGLIQMLVLARDDAKRPAAAVVLGGG